VMCKIEDKKGSQVVCKIVYTQTLDGTGPWNSQTLQA
jgi:hypothetical protein